MLLDYILQIIGIMHKYWVLYYDPLFYNLYETICYYAISNKTTVRSNSMVIVEHNIS